MRYHRVSNVSFANTMFRMHSIKDDWGIDDVVLSAIERGVYGEGQAMSWWLAMLRVAEPSSTFLDIGSYTGLYSLVAAAARQDTRTIAIEASVVTYGRLVQNVLVNNFDARITPCHVAVGNRFGVAKLGHAFGPLSMASGESLKPDYEVDHSELVPEISLDEWIFQHSSDPFGSVSSRAMGVLPLQRLAGVKIDVEGVEFDVLRGASRLLSEFKPPIIIEILTEDSLKICKSYLKSFGYHEIARCIGENYVYACRDLDGLRTLQSELVQGSDLNFLTNEILSVHF